MEARGRSMMIWRVHELRIPTRRRKEFWDFLLESCGLGTEAVVEILQSGTGSLDSFVYNSSVSTYTDPQQGMEREPGPLASQPWPGGCGRVVRTGS